MRLSRALVSHVVTWSAVMVAIWGVYVAWPKSTVQVYSQLTGKRYAVRNTHGAKDAADRLATLEMTVNKFLHAAERVAPGDYRLKNIRLRWNGTLREIADDKDVAYSLGKDAIYMCVRRPDGSLEDANTSVYVLIHELAHIATNSYGHHETFWANMKWLLEVASATGFYTYQDFDATPTSFCGQPLSANPLTCVRNGTCQSELKK